MWQVKLNMFQDAKSFDSCNRVLLSIFCILILFAYYTQQLICRTLTAMTTCIGSISLLQMCKNLSPVRKSRTSSQQQASFTRHCRAHVDLCCWAHKCSRARQPSFLPSFLPLRSIPSNQRRSEGLRKSVKICLMGQHLWDLF